MIYGSFKDLSRRATWDKVLRDKVFNIAKNPKSDEYLKGLASMFYKSFDKKSSGVALTHAWSEIPRSETLATRDK